VSSHGQATFTRGTSCLCFVRCPFTRLRQPRITEPSRRSRDRRSRRAFGAETARDPASVASASGTSRPNRLHPRGRAHPTHGASGPFTPSAPKVTHPHFRHRRPAPFGWAVPAQQNSHNSSSINVFIKSPLRSPSVNPKPRVGRNQQPGRTWQDASEDHFLQQALHQRRLLSSIIQKQI
jgi:hypothetical protein